MDSSDNRSYDQLHSDIRRDYEAQIEFFRQDRLDRQNAELASLQAKIDQKFSWPDVIRSLTSIGLTFMFIYGLIKWDNAEDDDKYKEFYLTLWLIPVSSAALTILLLCCGCSCILCMHAKDKN